MMHMRKNGGIMEKENVLEIETQEVFDKVAIRIKYQNFEVLKINIPNSTEEQQKIGDFFKKIDELIETQSSKVELLKGRKQGFLQKMFI